MSVTRCARWLFVVAALGCGGESAEPAAVQQPQAAGMPPSAAGGAGAGAAQAVPMAGAVAGASGTRATPMTQAPTPQTAGMPADRELDAGAPPQTVDAGPGPEPSTPEPSKPWEWPIGKPEDFGLDQATLDSAANTIQRSTGNRYGMVVVRKGTLIYEKYWQGTKDSRYVIYSCTKSWGSSLI